MTFQPAKGEINWKIHFASSLDTFFDALFLKISVIITEIASDTP